MPLRLVSPAACPSHRLTHREMSPESGSIASPSLTSRHSGADRLPPDFYFARAAATAVVFLVLSCLLAFGQTCAERDQSEENRTPPGNTPEAESQITNPAAESDGSAPPEKKSRRGELVFAPIPVSSPALGSGVIPVAGFIFPISRQDKISPPSVIGAAGLITDNGSRAFAVAGDFFLKQDTYRIATAFLRGNLNYNLYGIGAVAGNAGVKLPLEQDGAVFLAEFLRRVKWKFFLGPRLLTGHSTITLRTTESTTVPIPPDLGVSTNLTSLGVSLKRDTRDNRFYPNGGTVFEFTADLFAKGLGSRYSFQSYRVMFNKYWGLSPKQVLAYNAYFCATAGEPPFYGQCIYGVRNELRGYEAGRYLEEYMIATQLEYRLVLPKRFGLVGFGGIGGIAPNASDFFRNSNFLPAGGGGLRFMLSKTYHVNLRADFATGKNEHTFGMGVSEAF